VERKREAVLAKPDELLLLNKSAHELEIMMGEALVADEFGAKDLTNVEKQATARRWFAAHLSEFREALCVSPIRTEIFSAAKSDRNMLFAAVVDGLGKIHGLPVPVAVLSARLVHYGLDQLCAETEGRPKDSE
jgi:hypothetical protein